MFCINCGSKLLDGAKFCSECGTCLDSIKSNTANMPEQNVQNGQSVFSYANTDSENKKNFEVYNELEQNPETIKRQLIHEMFYDTFNDSRIFGEHVYIIGKNPINQEIKENLKEYYLEDNSEKPLLVFDYKNALENGFVITDHRLVWYYGSYGRQSIELEDIYDLNVGKAVLATVFRPIDSDNVQYPNIYLDGIRELDIFIVKFNKFLDIIYDYFYGEYEDEDEEKNSEGHGNNEKNEDLIAHACHVISVNSVYCVIGEPIISPSAKKYIVAKKNFKIPEEDNIFLIFDSTILGSCEKGFALCSSGFYYCQSVCGYLSWEQFAKQKVTYGLAGLKVAGELFNVGFDGKNLSIILNTIKELFS